MKALPAVARVLVIIRRWIRVRRDASSAKLDLAVNAPVERYPHGYKHLPSTLEIYLSKGLAREKQERIQLVNDQSRY